MYTTATLARFVSAGSIAGIAAIALSAPSAAFAADGEGADIGFAKHGHVAVQPIDAGAARNQVETPPVDVRRLLNDIDTPLSPGDSGAQPEPASVPSILVDDESFELVQVALGALAGASLTAAFVGAFSTRRRHHAPQAA